jgi:hypothetical protein
MTDYDTSVKLCECGCGNPAPISKENRQRNGYIKGQPVHFIRGHSGRVHPPSLLPSSLWIDIKELYLDKHLSTIEIGKIKGCDDNTIVQHLRQKGITLRNHNEQMKLRFAKNPPKHKLSTIKQGYIFIYKPDHPNCQKNGWVAEHRLVVEKRLGRYLLKGEKVHHKNAIKHDNRDDNLEVLSPTNHQLREQFCHGCELKKEIRLLHWEIKQLRETLQLKLNLGGGL